MATFSVKLCHLTTALVRGGFKDHAISVVGSSGMQNRVAEEGWKEGCDKKGIPHGSINDEMQL